MDGWLYLIRNGDLYKIGVTRNFENRMRQLKPDYIVAKLYSSNFKQLERELHRRYKKVRIPQTEYFRLDKSQIREIRKTISSFNYPKRIFLYIFINSTCLSFILFLIVFLLTSLTINEIRNILLISLQLMEKISFVLSFLSFFHISGRYLSLLNEFKFRSSRSIVFTLIALCFRFLIEVYF